MLRPNMPFFQDQEGQAVPAGLPPIIGSHVHIFPREIFSSIWKWFDDNAWRIRYQMNSSRVLEFLLSHGIKHVIALQYAHRPGIARQIKDFPNLKICVPHLGLDEILAYRKLIEKYNNLWLDTTMALAGYFPAEVEISLGGYRSDRIMYGSDFPNVPYEWDRELKMLAAANISDEVLERIAYKNAADFFNLDLTAENS